MAKSPEVALDCTKSPNFSTPPNNRQRVGSSETMGEGTCNAEVAGSSRVREPISQENNGGGEHVPQPVLPTPPTFQPQDLRWGGLSWLFHGSAGQLQSDRSPGRVGSSKYGGRALFSCVI